MAGKFNWTRFADVDLNDPFFNSLKKDYIEFSEWFQKKITQGESALVYKEDATIGAFIYLKNEYEDIKLKDGHLEAKKRIKIGTLKLSESIRNVRLGEGAIGVALWRWKESSAEEIYLTVFKKHTTLISLLERFGFINVGENDRGECVYLRSKSNVNYEDVYKCFPFINPDFRFAGLLPIEDYFHDILFPYSELKRNKQELEESVAGNGVTKVYIATPKESLSYYVGEPLCVYRKYNGKQQKGFNSVVTSYITITKIRYIKKDNVELCSLDDFIKLCGNKTIFDEMTLRRVYGKRNVVVLEMVYNGYFGSGNNVNYFTLDNNGLFETYPYQLIYTKTQFEKILSLGKVNIEKVYK